MSLVHRKLVMALERIDYLEKQIKRRDEIIDGLLQHCPEGECADCSIVVCPHADPMHFHHDGCPACAELGEVP